MSPVEMLEKKKRGLAGFNREILLNFGAFLTAEWRIGQDYVITVFLLNIGEVFSQGIGMHNIGRFDPVQDHIHCADDIGQRLLFFAVEGFLL